MNGRWAVLFMNLNTPGQDFDFILSGLLQFVFSFCLSRLPSLCVPPADYGRHRQGKENFRPEVCSMPHSGGGGQAQGGPQPLGTVRTQDRPGTGLLVHRRQQE